MNRRKFAYAALLSCQAVLTTLAAMNELPGHWAAGFGLAALFLTTFLKEFNAPELPPKGPSVIE